MKWLCLFLATVVSIADSQVLAGARPAVLTRTELRQLIESRECHIPPAHLSDTPGISVYPEYSDMVDVKPLIPGLQVFDAGVSPVLLLAARKRPEAGTSELDVMFIEWRGSTWQEVELVRGLSVPGCWNETLPNHHPRFSRMRYFRAITVEDWQDFDKEVFGYPDLEVEIVDGTIPVVVPMSIDGNRDWSEVVKVKIGDRVPIRVCFFDGDHDPTTTDVIEIYFEATMVGTRSWETFAIARSPDANFEMVGADGSPLSVRQEPLEFSDPPVHSVEVYWDTSHLSLGEYHMRAVGVDAEGNTSILVGGVTVTVSVKPR